MNTKAIITDLDGTILPSGGTISETTIKTLTQLKQKGIIRIIATGRTLFAARKFLPDNFPIDYLIFSSGCGILRWQDKKIISSHQLNCQAARKIANYLWDYNINFAIQQEIPDNHYFYYTHIYPEHPDFRRRVEKFQEFGTLIHQSCDIRKDATQFLLILDATQLKWLTSIRQDLHPYSVIRSTSPFDPQAIWIEVYPSGINKGSSCLELFRHLHITAADCAGLGNDYNDVDFLDICEKAFVVKNAPERLRQNYKSVASDRDNGFIEFIRHVL